MYNEEVPFSDLLEVTALSQCGSEMKAISLSLCGPDFIKQTLFV